MPFVQAGPEGLAAGVLGEATGVSATNVSFHLKELERAGLIGARRQARSIIYAADYPALAGLLQFLMEDCCAGRPEICAPALANPSTPPDRRSPSMADRTYHVLFLCTGNTARSIPPRASCAKTARGGSPPIRPGVGPKGP